MRKINLEGKRFGRLTVLKQDTIKRGTQLLWICQCDCGTIKSIMGNTLKSGHAISCGCYTVLYLLYA